MYICGGRKTFKAGQSNHKSINKNRSYYIPFLRAFLQSYRQWPNPKEKYLRHIGQKKKKNLKNYYNKIEKGTLVHYG